MKILIPLILLSLLQLTSCKKDSSDPNPITSLSLTTLSLDGRPFSYYYTNTSVSPEVILKFSVPIDEASARESITLGTSSLSSPLTFSFSNSDSVVTVKPTAALKGFTNYTLTIPSVLKSADQKTLGSNISVKLVTQIDPTDKFPRISDDELLDLIQKKTLNYFTSLSHPASGMARERNNSDDVVTTGGSGFGIMAIVAGVDRGFIPRADGIAQFRKIVTFLEKADRFHGVWPHWMSGATGKVIPFSPNDNGADLVESSFMAQGLITLREYLKLTPSDTVGNNMINRIDNLWKAMEWDWFRQENQQNVLYWHWSPDKAWIMNFAMYGYFEEHVTYFLAAASPTHSIPKIVYTNGFAQNGAIVHNNKYTYNNESYTLPLGGTDPLFWVQYSYLGMDPHFSDDYANYWTQNVNATLINHAYCVANPKHYAAYSDSCWGLTASDNENGYGAQSPSNDNGTITPTAALSSFPYAPVQSMKALKFFYYTMGDRLLGQYGFYDAFNPNTAWVASSTLAIDQGPIVVMIENYRSGLLWNLFESAPEVKAARIKLGFH